MKAAVALDIDGVIFRGKHIIPGAATAIKRLVESRFPFVFMTNGGGLTEAQKALEITHKLDLHSTPIDTEQVIVSHTPFQSLAPKYRNEPILVLGRRECLDIARHYGFQKPISSIDIHAARSSLLPTRSNLSHSNAPFKDSIDSIAAAFIFHDPVDWTLDMQVLSDVLVNNQGHLANISSPSTQRIPLYACNADIVYNTEYPSPRFTQGAFVESFRHLFQIYHHSALKVQYFGKPYSVQYKYAETLLKRHAESLGLPLPTKFYGVGDNPKSDIRGANLAGDQWQSILVHTGLFPSSSGNCKEDPSDHVFPSIVEAVDYIIASNM